MDKKLLLDRLDAEGEDRLLLAKLLDRAGQARQRNIPAASDFLSPRQQILASDLLRLGGIGEQEYIFTGGYDGAERKFILFLPDWMDRESAVLPVRCLRAAYRADDRLTHRDLLGSLMGMGIMREKIGDILVSADSADVLVMDGVFEFLLRNWNTAGRASLQVTETELSCVHIPAAKFEEIRDTVHSTRLDAVAACGFRTSRGKASELIAAGRVQVNWRDCVKPDKMLDRGDIITAKGFGKIELLDIGVPTRKGRLPVMIRRYQ